MLKLIAILLIFLSHVVQTLRGSETGLLTNTDWIVDYTKPGSGLTNLILAIISYSGQLGNMIFIICSCWFLLDKTTSNNKKLLRIFLDVFVISILYLIGIGSYIGFTNLGIKKIIKCILPNYFGNNWFITCYFVFALITPLVNTVIKSFNKQVHFIVSLICLLIYFILGFVVSLNGTICNTLIIWLALYLIISYLKTYGLKLCNSYKVNIIFITLGFCCLIIMTTLIYFVGCKVSLLNDLTKWNKVNSPFLLLIGIGLFNIFYKFKFSSKFINYISSLSFLI